MGASENASGSTGNDSDAGSHYAGANHASGLGTSRSAR
jgi:hypothetical protein